MAEWMDVPAVLFKNNTSHHCLLTVFVPWTKKCLFLVDVVVNEWALVYIWNEGVFINYTEYLLVWMYKVLTENPIWIPNTFFGSKNVNALVYEQIYLYKQKLS